MEAFREIYTQYSRALLPQNEVVVIGTQYESINDVKNTLRLSGVDVERYLNEGNICEKIIFSLSSSLLLSS